MKSIIVNMIKNINQLARYVNIHKEEVNQEVLNEVEKKMAEIGRAHV